MEELDQVLDLLSEERRRYALYYLEQQDDPVSVEEVAEQIAEWEANGSAASIPEEKFGRIEVELYHADLPKASEAKYIKYDCEEGIVELTGAPPEFSAIVSVAKVIERPSRNP